MSATKDQSQKHTFVYENMYLLYKKGQQAANESAPVAFPRVTPPSTSYLSEHSQKQWPTKKEQLQTELESKRSALTGLRSSLTELSALHDRLTKMMDEIKKLKS